MKSFSGDRSPWMIRIVCLLSCAAVVVCAEESPPCPPSTDVFPCYCDDVSDPELTIVNCDDLRNLDKLRPVLEKTRGTGLSFSFRESRLGNVPSDLFAGQRSESLDFYSCEVGSFGDRPFSGLEDSLARLLVADNVDKRGRGLEFLPLGHLRRLEDLSFKGNGIVSVGNDWFRGGPATLKQVSLQGNEISEIGDAAFSDLTVLEQLCLASNDLEDLSRTMLPRPALKLTILDFSNNGITALPEDMFDEMPALTYINVSGNDLKTLDEAVFGRVWRQLEDVYALRLFGFECDTRLKWIFRQKLPTRLRGSICAGDNPLSGKKLEKLKVEDFE